MLVLLIDRCGPDMMHARNIYGVIVHISRGKLYAVNMTDSKLLVFKLA